MKKTLSEYKLLEYGSSVFEPDDLIAVSYESKRCRYRWGIPFKNFQAYEDLKEPYKIDDLVAIGGKLLDILVIGQHSIQFKDSKTGVHKLDVVVRSSETEDRQLLHKLSSEFRAKVKQIDRDNIPGTNNNDNE